MQRSQLDFLKVMVDGDEGLGEKSGKNNDREKEKEEVVVVRKKIKTV